MKNTMRIFVFCCVSFFLLLSNVNADSFFPKTSELFGISMPSLSSVIGREPNKETVSADGLHQEYYQFTYNEYKLWGNYLASNEFNVIEQSITNRIYTCKINKEQDSIVFEYDGENHSCRLLYPNGTRPETEKTESKSTNKNILPEINTQIGIAFPSVASILSESTFHVTSLDDGRTILCFPNVSEEQYHLFSQYLSLCGCTAVSSSILDKKIYVTIEYHGNSFDLEYNCILLELVLIYPDLYYVEDYLFDDNIFINGILPDGKEIFDSLAPSIAKAIGWAPNRTENSKEKGYTEIYDYFYDTDYKFLSEYLLKKNCSIVSSSSSGSDLTFILDHNGTQFSFTYDRILHTASASYPSGVTLEPIMDLKTRSGEKAKLDAMGVNTSSSQYYSSSECYSIAKEYFYSRPWKNPASVSIIDYTTVYGSDYYTFYINYTAQNGFGGNNRETYIIMVDYRTGTVTTAYSY